MAVRILNQHSSDSKDSPEQVALRLKQAINQLKSEFYDLETGGVNYTAMKGSDGYLRYLEAATLLQKFDLNLLSDQAARLAFWINIYNALTVHGIIDLGVHDSVREISGFFGSVAYRISDMVFTLDDIEHGILRRNAKKHLIAFRPFGGNDPRIKHVLAILEPRIHFTLVCGSKSCPPIGTYQEEKIEQQLKLAASSFINSDNVVLETDKNRLTISKIFQWYGKDFGSKSDLIRFIAEHRQNLQEKDYILQNQNRITIRFQDYDWSLNH